MSSFVRKGKKKTPGIPSKHGLSLASTNILDTLLQGGLPLGSIVLIEEDVLADHYLQTLRCIMATDTVLWYDPEQIQWREIVPVVVKQAQMPDNTEMKIAFRYADLTQTREIFDISKTTTSEKIHTFMPDNNWNSFGLKILEDIQNTLTSESDTEIRKIVLKSFMSPLWATGQTSEVYKFLRELRRITRSINGISVITVSPYAISNQLLTMLNQFSDLVLKFTTLAEYGDVVGNYTGVLHVKKCLWLHAFDNLELDEITYGLTRSAKTLAIEKFSPPPEGEEETKSSTDF